MSESFDIQAMMLSMLKSQLKRTTSVVDDKGDFEQFCAEKIKVRTPQSQIVSFTLRDIQKQYLAAKRAATDAGKAPRFLLLKYRRGGFTTVEQAVSYHLSSRNPNISVVTLAQDQEVTARIFRIPRLMHEMDPNAPEIKGVGNQYRLEFPALNSIFYVGTASGKGVGRGDTLSRVHWSEVAWSCLGNGQVEKQKQILTGLNEAASHGEVVLETTPNGSEMFREMYAEAKDGQSNWTAIFIPWFKDPTNVLPVGVDEAIHITKTLDDEEERLVRKHGLSPGQIKWRRSKKKDLKRLFYQEYPEDDETCWLTSGTPFFDPNVLVMLRDAIEPLISPPMIEHSQFGMIPPNCKIVTGGYVVQWEKPVEGVEYCMGVDTSEGLPSSDPNGFGIMRRDTGQQVASAHGRFSVRQLAAMVVEWAKTYNDALVGIERENHGFALIEKVIDLGLSKSHMDGGNLYYYTNTRAQNDKLVSKAGWSTNVITRPVMLEGLRDWLETDGVLSRLRDRQFLSECMTFRMQSDGSFAADPGAHDDSVMKWAIANQMRIAPWRRVTATIIRVSRWRSNR